jgi:hypothetical protein
MLTKNDIVYSGQQTDRVIMAIALGIDGEVVLTIPTFVDFYEFLLANKTVVCVTDDCDVVNFVNGDEVVETLSVDPLWGSVLASNPDIMEIVRRNPDNSLIELTDEIRTKMAVVPGWTYDSTGFITPEGWALLPLPTEEQVRALQNLREQSGE